MQGALSKCDGLNAEWRHGIYYLVGLGEALKVFKQPGKRIGFTFGILKWQEGGRVTVCYKGYEDLSGGNCMNLGRR